MMYDDQINPRSGHYKMVTQWLPFLIICTGFHDINAGSVNTTNQVAALGNSVSITCTYTVGLNEVFQYLYIDTYITNRGFVDVVKFWANGTTEYLPFSDRIINRTTLVVQEGSVALRFDKTLCSDVGDYYCNLQTNESYVYKLMHLQVRGPSETPSVLLTKQSGCYDVGNEVEAICVGIVGGTAATFKWYGYRKDNTTVELTQLADHGPPYRPPSSCSYKRTSHIKFNISASDDGMVLRCVIEDNEAGIMPSVTDQCGLLCFEADPIHLRRHPQKPNLVGFRTSACPGGKIQASCYGEIGGPRGYYKWYKHKAGQDPVDITSSADPGTPYRLYSSCQYERASMITLTASVADNGVVLRCVLHNQEVGISGAWTEVCEGLCTQSRQVTVQASCEAITTTEANGIAPIRRQSTSAPGPMSATSSGGTTPNTNIFVFTCTSLLLWAV